MQPLLVFSYGMTKCGSTLAFQLARAALEQAGCDQPRLSTAALGNNRKINFVQHVDAPMAAMIVQEVAKIGHPIVIKTHTALDPAVRQFFADGLAIGHATYRDPRDMALSMMDAGKAARESGAAAFSEITDLNAALKAVRDQTTKLAEWLGLPNMLPLCFDDIAFDTPGVAERMLAQFGLTGNAQRIAAKAKSARFTQFNKGVTDRYRAEMSAEESGGIAREFAPFLETLINNRRALPENGPVIPLDFAPTRPEYRYAAKTLAGVTA